MKKTTYFYLLSVLMLTLSLFMFLEINTVYAAPWGARRCIDKDSDTFSPTGGKCGPVDCNDSNSTIYPGAIEVCGNNIDEDCSGADLECDYDFDNDGFDAIQFGGNDCDDNNAAINPQADEICGNDIDENCDMVVEECEQNNLGLLLHLPFDNNYADVTGNNNVTCLGNCPTISDDGDRTAYYFNGSSCLDLGANDSLDLVNTPFTLSAWIKPSTVGLGYIVGKIGNTNAERHYGMFLYNDNTFRTFTNNYNRHSSGFTAPVNTWSYVTMTWDGTTKKAFVNGGLKGSWTGEAITTDNLNPLVGCRHSGTTIDGEFNGAIDDVRIYNRVLSQEEIESLYNYNSAPNDCPDADSDMFTDQICGGLDCNDNDPEINPEMDEICGNDIDENCDNIIEECLPDCPDTDNDGYTAQNCGGNDCNDNNPAINPGAVDICENGIDEDCSGNDLTCPEDNGQATISSVSDTTLIQGQAVTINGSGFGINENTPNYWDNFDDGLAQGLDITSNPGMHDPDISNIEKHSGNYSLRTRLGDPDVEAAYSALRNGYAIYWFPHAMQAGEKVFFSFWERWNWGDWYCADGGQATSSYQIKNFRISSGNQAVTPPDFPQNNQSDCNDYPGEDFGPRNYLTSAEGDTDWYGRDFEPELAHMHTKWMLFEVQVKQSHDGQSDGSFEMWVTREGQTRKVVNFQNVPTHVAGDPGFNKITLGNWIDAFGRSTTLYFDDLFVDLSWQRVAIGNNQDYYSSTKRAIQPFNAWGNNSITINANLTTFDQNDQLYLFVFDADGNPSQGYPVHVE